MTGRERGEKANHSTAFSPFTLLFPDQSCPICDTSFNLIYQNQRHYYDIRRTLPVSVNSGEWERKEGKLKKLKGRKYTET